MFLLADTTQVSPPYYLVSGDLAIPLADTVSVANLRSSGIPLVQGTPEDILALTTALIGD